MGTFCPLPFNKQGEKMSLISNQNSFGNTLPSYVREVSTRGRSKLTEEQKIKAQDLLEKAKDEDSRMVKGVFTNIECKGGDIEFTYHKYKGDPTRVYRFEDGKEYEVPLGVAKHINSCKYSRKAHNPNILQKNESGNWAPIDGKPDDRFKFTSTDFM